jgi:hypothetical protein
MWTVPECEKLEKVGRMAYESDFGVELRGERHV